MPNLTRCVVCHCDHDQSSMLVFDGAEGQVYCCSHHVTPADHREAVAIVAHEKAMQILAYRKSVLGETLTPLQEELLKKHTDEKIVEFRAEVARQMDEFEKMGFVKSELEVRCYPSENWRCEVMPL